MLWTRFSAVVDRQPDAVALDTDRQVFTYAQLRGQACHLAAQLRQGGFKAGDVAGIFVPNSPAFVCSVLALLCEGGVCLPLNTKYKEQELIRYLVDSKARVVLTQPGGSHYFARLSPDFPTPPPRVLEVHLEGEPAVSHRPEPVPGESPMLLQYSTGSTGESKLVLRTQNHLQAEFEHYTKAVALSPADRVLGVVPLFHAHGFANGMMGALLSGAELVLLDNFNPRAVHQILVRKQITVFPGVPFMFKMLSSLKVPEKPSDFARLRLCFSAGAALEEGTSEAFETTYGQPVRQLYGTTETGSISINLHPDRASLASSVGAPMDGIEVAILDEEGQPLPAGTVGEIAVRSPAMTPSYLHQPEVTARFFREGWFLPGDLAVLDEKFGICLRGRKTLFINVSGNKVDPAEVERHLLTHPAVADCAVIGQQAPAGYFVKAFVVSRSPVGKEELIGHCRGAMAEFKVPKAIEFISEIPRSPLGKILRKYLE
jgi:long-chain acyl-CoA synthetase